MDAKHKIDRTCKNCKYYVKNFCYRFPPQIVLDNNCSAYMMHPTPLPEDRCGEWSINPKLEQHESD